MINDGYKVGYVCPVTGREFTALVPCDDITLDALARAQEAYTESLND